MDNILLTLYKLFSTVAGLVGWPYFFWHLKSRGQGESLLAPPGPEVAGRAATAGLAPPVAPRRLRGRNPGRHPPGRRTPDPPAPGRLYHQHRHRNRANAGSQTLFPPGRPGLLLSPGHSLGGQALSGLSAPPGVHRPGIGDLAEFFKPGAPTGSAPGPGQRPALR